MGVVVVCRYQRTKAPLFVEQAGVNLYSLEELSYFLYHNICLADRRFFDERLCRWLKEEIGCEELALSIQKGVSSGASFPSLVRLAAGASGLFGEKELAELEERLRGLATLTEQERLKLRADELLNNRNEWAAIEEYRHILNMHQNSRLGMGFYGAVWNNLGVCYARQFLFRKAAGCFETSYEYQPDEEIRKEAELAWQMAEGILPEAGEKRQMPADPQKVLLKWEREYRVRQKQ
jgi:hypothetical protein